MLYYDGDNDRRISEKEFRDALNADKDISGYPLIKIYKANYGGDGEMGMTEFKDALHDLADMLPDKGEALWEEMVKGYKPSQGELDELEFVWKGCSNGSRAGGRSMNR